MYKFKAIQFLNPKLGNANDALQISTIFAIVNLLHIEVGHNLVGGMEGLLNIWYNG
jgi:hypothetical protein